jgi:hypothetical protein
MSPDVALIDFLLARTNADRQRARQVVASVGATLCDAAAWPWYRQAMTDFEFRRAVVFYAMQRGEYTLCHHMAQLWNDHPDFRPEWTLPTQLQMAS